MKQLQEQNTALLSQVNELSAAAAATAGATSVKVCTLHTHFTYMRTHMLTHTQHQAKQSLRQPCKHSLIQHWNACASLAVRVNQFTLRTLQASQSETPLLNYNPNTVKQDKDR